MSCRESDERAGRRAVWYASTLIGAAIVLISTILVVRYDTSY
jgi:hypothetical protein